MDPSKRYTAEQALNSPFFQHLDVAPMLSRPLIRRRLKVYMIVVLTLSRLKTLKNKPQPIKTIDLIENPYRFKTYRKVIDTAAFTIYGHWVKKGEQQNRAALFEIEPKSDLKSIHTSRIEVASSN